MSLRSNLPLITGNLKDQTVSAHIFRIASSSGTATPAITSKSIKTASITTKPMSRAAALALEDILTGLNGGTFYSKAYLDTAPRLYRLQPNQWSWNPEGEDSYSCSFVMTEVLANATDIPIVDTLSLERTSRVKTVQFGDGYEQIALMALIAKTIVIPLKPCLYLTRKRLILNLHYQRWKAIIFMLNLQTTRKCINTDLMAIHGRGVHLGLGQMYLHLR